MRSRTISPSACAAPPQYAAPAALASNPAFGALVDHQFESADEPEAARIADQRVLPEPVEPGPEARNHRRGLLDESRA